MWTRNRVQAAPVVVSRRHLETAQPQAVVVNAGVANAATGRPGEEDALATAARTASLLGLRPEEVVVLSTGVIGPRLPMEKLLAGVDAAAAALSPDGGAIAARGDPDHRHRAEDRGRRRGRVHRRRAWRRARG